MVLNTATHEIF